jgi:hypothetical protein
VVVYVGVDAGEGVGVGNGVFVGNGVGMGTVSVSGDACEFDSIRKGLKLTVPRVKSFLLS